MRVRLSLFTLLVIASIGAALAVMRQADNGAAAGNWKIIVVNVAADSGRGRPQPAPTPVYDHERWVNIQLNINVGEPAISETGLAAVSMTTDAIARHPTEDEPVVTVRGTFNITPHPGDDECTWTRTITKPELNVTFYYTGGGLPVEVSFDGPRWHYTVVCSDPDNPIRLRYPESGEFRFEYYLIEPLRTWRTANSNEVAFRFPVNFATDWETSCIKRSGDFSGKGIPGALTHNGRVRVEVRVYEPHFPGGCLLPLHE